MLTRLKFLTAGESHGPGLTGILEGLPAGISIDIADLRNELKRRQKGVGRGKRMAIEDEQVEIRGGVRYGKTLGSPIALWLPNRDWDNWHFQMCVETISNPAKPVTLPRPGHADFAGALKYGTSDIRNILERASARETAMRVALGFLAKQFLAACGIKITSFVSQIGGIIAPEIQFTNTMDLQHFGEMVDASPVRCPDPEASGKMSSSIERAQNDGDSLGGRFGVVATGLPVGLGSHVHWDRKLDARLAAALMSINAAKSVTVGTAAASEQVGTTYHDEIIPAESGITRTTNHAGGIEGGMSNGMPIVLEVAMKPIPTLIKPLRSVDLISGEAGLAHKERTDSCVVPAAGVIGEAMVALVLADALLEKFGGDSLEQTLGHLAVSGQYLYKFKPGKDRSPEGQSDLKLS